MSDSDISMDKSQRHKSPIDFSKRLVPTEDLIELVRQHPSLWDRHCPEYRDRLAKDKAWTDVYTHFEPEYESLNKILKVQIGAIITKKWYNVRDSYRKSLKPGSRNTRPYIYSDRLKFLEHVFSHEDYSCKVKGETSYIEERLSNDDVQENEEQETWLDEVFIDIDEENVNTPGPATPAKRPKLEYPPRDKNTHEADDSIVAVLANLIQKEEDEDRAFFKSITPSVKSLSERSKFVFRIQVMKLINTLKARDRKLTILKRENTNIDSDTE